MGRGDRRTKKGKISAGSFGISRPHAPKKKAAAPKKAAAKKAAPKKAAAKKVAKEESKEE